MKRSVVTFQDVYRRYVRDVNKFAFWLCGDSDVAKDITSETFIRLWTSKNELAVETVKAYLFKIARNLFLQKKRNQKLTIQLDDNLVDRATQPDTRAEACSELKHVLNDIQQLPEIDRMVLIMNTYDDLSYKEISRILGLSVSAIKVKIHRARLKLALLYHAKEER